MTEIPANGQPPHGQGKAPTPPTNITAQSVRTIDWLSAVNTTFAVPVYQRHYRWEVDACQQLLADIRAVASGDGQQTHFFGSILYTATAAGGATERMLVDGQQRVTTLMLLVSALRDTFANSGGPVPSELDDVLLHPWISGRTRLRLRQEGALELDSIAFGRPVPKVEVEVSHLQDNYEFFIDEIRGDAPVVWTGLQRLEHVAITLGMYANPQQVFESLNSTHTRLRTNELIHNYILMGLTYDQQIEIEDSFWIPIEANTGDAIDNFLRDYLILRTGRDSEFGSEHGVYNVFRGQFPRPTFGALTKLAAEWKLYSGVYRILLDPRRETDGDVRRQLRYVNTFGTATYPLLLGVYRDYQSGMLDKAALLAVLDQLQSLYLRRMVVGASRDHLSAQLCRKRQQYGHERLADAMARRTPTDDRIRLALSYQPLPHAGYVLRRLDEHGLEEAGGLGDLEVEHIFPQFPQDSWSGDGLRTWSAFSEVERAKYREILSTIGNLALLEQPLNAAASNKPFQRKREYYKRSRVPSAIALVEDDRAVWDLGVVAERTRLLTDAFLDTWRRVSTPPDPEALVPILDASKKPSFYKGHGTELEYAVFSGETLEVRNHKELFNRVFKRLWDTRRADVLAYSDAHNGPISETDPPRKQWDVLPPSHFLFMGLFPQWMLDETQLVLDHFDLADEVFLKYSTDED